VGRVTLKVTRLKSDEVELVDRRLPLNRLDQQAARARPT
jgi:hypothetical protein